MPFNEGVVEAVSVKPLPEADQYGNNFKRSVLVGEQWYYAGKGKSEKFNVKTKDGWHSLGKGDKIEFRYENADWGDGVKTVKSMDITVVEKGSPQEATAPSKGSTVTKTWSGGNDAGIKIGHAVNVAVQMLPAKATVEQLEEKSWEVLAMTHKMNDGYAEFVKTLTAKPEAKEEKPKAKAGDGFDDDEDLPF